MISPSFPVWRLVAWGACAAMFSSATVHGGLLALHDERASPFDLEVCGTILGRENTAGAFVRWSDLRALPTSSFMLEGEFARGTQRVTVVFLSDLWNALPVAPRADVLLATCTDGYAGIYSREQIEVLKPFLVLEIDGQGPEMWPPPGLTFNPAPYVISVAESVSPAVAAQLDANHKRPWGVTKIELARYEDRFAGALTGHWAALSPLADEGRTIWINSCLSCHHGPGSTFGGTKSDRPFEVIAAHAAYNAAYFKRYVRNPQGEISGAKMEAHPHYTDEQLDALIAFITADRRP